MEIFKVIREYPLYSVSNMGRVRKNSNGKIMTASKKMNGYMIINLFTGDGRRKKELIHRLVALTFLNNVFHLPEVNHIDGVRDNNRSDNLEWVTRKENVSKSSLPKRVKVRNKNEQECMIFESITDACLELGLTPSNVSACLHGKQQTHKGFIFETIF